MSAPNVPAAQYMSSEHVINEFYHHGLKRLQRLSALQVLLLALMAGGLITMGALFSVLLAQGIEAEGPKRLVQGLAFTAGFFSVILSSAILFTEVNVVLPATLLHLHDKSLITRVMRFWLLTWIGNLGGALLFGWMVNIAQYYPPEIYQDLSVFVGKKMHYAEVGTPAAWFKAMLSGVIANWLVGMAAFFATMGRTIFGKYIPVFLLVSLFVAGNFQHSPANMGYFSLIMAHGEGPGWGPAMLWNIIPVGIGNIIGGAFLVAIPFWYALRGEAEDQSGHESQSE
ncbi:MAG: formate/nitrite transporter family protein [candidate division Zixibacteria bacterium]|nr:formate/nitrite transporter family protein [candidate division Zixibacteria bacterium]